MPRHRAEEGRATAPPPGVISTLPQGSFQSEVPPSTPTQCRPLLLPHHHLGRPWGSLCSLSQEEPMGGSCLLPLSQSAFLLPRPLPPNRAPSSPNPIHSELGE